MPRRRRRPLEIKIASLDEYEVEKRREEVRPRISYWVGWVALGASIVSVVLSIIALTR